MERSHLAVLLGLLAFAAVIIPAATVDDYHEPPLPCEDGSLAYEVRRHCAHGAGPSDACCRLVVATVELYGGVPCVCLVAANPSLSNTGFDDAAYLLELYTVCGGDRLTATCKWEKEPAAPPPSSERLHTRRHLSQQHLGIGVQGEEDIPADAALPTPSSLE